MMTKKIFDKGPAIGGVTMHRIGLFSGKTKNDNAWATMTLSRPLSEGAQCCLEACFYAASKMALTRSGEIVLYVDYYALDRVLGWHRHYCKIDDTLDQLQTTLVSIEKHVKKEDGTDLKIMTRQAIVSSATHIVGVVPTKISTGLSRLREIKRVKVTLSKAYVQMLQADVTMHYLQLIPAILALKHKESRTLARFCLSHAGDQTVSTKTILGILGEDLGSRMARKRVARLTDDAQGLEAIGIRWRPETKMVHYTRNPRILFTSPTTPSGPGPICEA